MLNKDYKEMLQILLKNKVKFLVVGAYAMGIHGYPRATGDLDIWVEASTENSEKIYQSISEFGAPLSEVTKSTFCEQGIVFQIGVAPRRIVIITKIDGVDFKKASSDKQEIEVEGIKIPFLSKKTLSKTKSQQVVKKINLMQNICVGIAMPNIMPNYESVQMLYTSNAGHQIPGYQVVAIRLSEHQVGFS